MEIRKAEEVTESPHLCLLLVKFVRARDQAGQGDNKFSLSNTSGRHSRETIVAERTGGYPLGCGDPARRALTLVSSFGANKPEV